MLASKFNPALPYRYIRYARMSSDQQNERSPEQQFETIDLTLRNKGFHWEHVADFRDDAKSGRYMRNRPGFSNMLRQIKTGMLQIDLILVDTLERFGRMQDLALVRRQLQNMDAVLVLTADSGFVDPTSLAGEALGFIENIRATTDGQVKAHNVLRGKRDAALLKRWPGGHPPFGYKIKTIINGDMSL